MNCVDERGQGGDSGVCGQRVPAEWCHGLSAAALRGAAGGTSAAAGAVPPGGGAGGRLCRGGVFSGACLSGRDTGKASGGSSPGLAGLWRGGKAAAADAAVFCRGLCYGGMRAGSGAGSWRRTYGQRHFLHGCGWEGTADRRSGGICPADRGVPGSGQACCERRAFSGSCVPG